MQVLIGKTITAAPLAIVAFLCSALASPVHADQNAATSYLLALMELDPPLPEYVESATTDDPEHGFTRPLSEDQRSFLRRTAIVSALARFDEASDQPDCDWARFTSASWSDARVNDRLHSLARIVLLRARAQYEAREWIKGNRDVERVRVLARRMALQARPFEHQCFMVENMATGTGAAYLLQFSNAALKDFALRHERQGQFSPKKQMLIGEAARIRAAADDCKSGRVSREQLLLYARPYLASDAIAERLRKSATEDVVGHLHGLAAFLSDLSASMDGAPGAAAQQIGQLYDRYAKSNPLVAGFGEPPMGDYLENAQGLCRGSMVGSVIECLLKDDDFSNIDDPYGQTSLKVQAENPGFTLTSELKYAGRPIGYRFGLAGAHFER